MARVIGNQSGGYATVQPTENYIGQAIQNNEASGFKYREEQRDAAAKQAAQAKAQAASLDKQADDDLKDADRLDAIRAKDSGISGIDSAVVNGMANERQKYIDATQKYKATQDKKYLVERSAAMNNLQSIANIPTSYQKVIDLTTQGISNGTIDKSEEKRVTDLGTQIEKGFVVPKIENGIMTFDVYNRDPNTGELTGTLMKNMKGEELINQLTPQKKTDFNKLFVDTAKTLGDPVKIIKGNTETIGVPDLDKKITEKVKDMFADPSLLGNLGRHYGIEEDPKTGEYSVEDKNKIGNKYFNDLKNQFNTVTNPNYDAENQQIKRRDQALQEERAKREKKEADSKNKAFAPPIDVVTKGGKGNALGIELKKGNKIFGPTYKDGKDGPVKGVVLKDNGTYSFSISTRKDDSLNARGLAKKKAFEDKPENAGTEYEPIDSDYVYSATKPTEFNSASNSNVINAYVRGMLNPSNGENFQNIKEYMNYYNKYKPSKTTSTTKTNTAKAKQVIQNGHTYTLNPATGKYE